MTAVFVLRHPETTWNAAERYQGRLDAPLSAKGEIQSREAALWFSGKQLDAVFASPMKRALTLARAIAVATGAELIQDHRLTEIGQMPWEGLYRAEIHARYRELARQWYERPDTVRFPGGESLLEVAARAQSALREIFERFHGGSVAVTTHSVVVQTLVAHALHLDLRYLHRVPAANAAVTMLKGDSAPGRLVSLNVPTSSEATAVDREAVKTTRRRIAS